MQDLAKRIAKSEATKESTKLTITMDIKNGYIEEVLLLSRITLRYEEQSEVASAT